nr:DUF1493 family protein [Pantoea vagans]
MHIARENFSIEACSPHEPVSCNPSKKPVPIPIPDFTPGMLIASAKAGRGLYD